ncbi:MAG: hypothetical protein ACMUEM_04775 [Flavobacteriales bacterium AspAUS03]
MPVSDLKEIIIQAKEKMLRPSVQNISGIALEKIPNILSLGRYRY